MERDEFNPTPEDLDFKGVTSRYSDIEGVSIDASKVPTSFRHLIDLAKYWSIGDDEELSCLMWLTPYEELKAFVLAVQPHRDEIWEWCSHQREQVPVPDEAIVFDTMLAADARSGSSTRWRCSAYVRCRIPRPAGC